MRPSGGERPRRQASALVVAGRAAIEPPISGMVGANGRPGCRRQRPKWLGGPSESGPGRAGPQLRDAERCHGTAAQDPSTRENFVLRLRAVPDPERAGGEL
jgi:hypothetical protein